MPFCVGNRARDKKGNCTQILCYGFIFILIKIFTIMDLLEQISKEVIGYELTYGPKQKANFLFCNREVYEELKVLLKTEKEIFAYQGCFIIAGDKKEFEYFLRGEKFRIGHAK